MIVLLVVLLLTAIAATLFIANSRSDSLYKFDDESLEEWEAFNEAFKDEK